MRACRRKSAGSPSTPLGQVRVAGTAAAEDAAEALLTMNSPASGVRKEVTPSVPEGVQIVSLTVDERNETERKEEKWALKDRREEANRNRHQREKIQAQRTLEKRASRTTREEQKLKAMNRLRRLKYKERMEKREADENERAKVHKDKARKAEQAAVKRRADRRKNMVARLSSVLEQQSAAHDLKIESLVRGDPLFTVENKATDEMIVQFSLDHLPRLQPRRWLNQEIVDWYLCMLTSGNEECLTLGAEFHRQLLMKNQGPEFVVDFHRPAALRGVQDGERFCALEGLRVILAPANPDGNHWVLIAIFPEQRKVSCYDSLSPGPKGTAACRKIVKGILSWVALHEMRRSGSIDGWTHEMVQGLPRQKNTWDCGIHVCDFARMLTREPPGTPLCTDEVAANTFRARLLVYALETALISY